MGDRRRLELAQVLIQAAGRSADEQDVVRAYLEGVVEFDEHVPVPLHRNHRRTGPFPDQCAPGMLARQPAGGYPDELEALFDRDRTVAEQVVGENLPCHLAHRQGDTFGARLTRTMSGTSGA